MRIACHCRLRPISSQIALISEWLELLRREYNYRLTERFNRYEQNRYPANACPLICHLLKLKDKPGFYSQKRDLINSEILFLQYRAIRSQVLQDCVEQAKKAFDRFLKEDSSGRRLGQPRFKGKGAIAPSLSRKPNSPASRVVESTYPRLVKSSSSSTVLCLKESIH